MNKLSAGDIRENRNRTAGQKNNPVCLVPSRFNRGVTLPDGHIAVYNTFSSALITIFPEMWEQFLSPGSRIELCGAALPPEAQELARQGLLVESDVNEVDMLRHRINKVNYGSRLKQFTVLPTLACNLKCFYCFEQQAQAESSNRFMSETVENCLLHYIAEQCKGTGGAIITWTGGEPLLAMETVSRLGLTLQSLFAKANKTLRGYMVTNGTLLTPKIVKRLLEIGVAGIQVTVDIPQGSRCDSSGFNYHVQILDKVAMAQINGLKVDLRINVIVDKEGEFDQIYDELKKRKIGGPSLSSLTFARVTETGESKCKTDSCHTGSDEIQTGLLRENIKALKQSFPIDILGLHQTGICAATSESNSIIDPNGLIYKCWRDVGIENKAYGSVIDSGMLKNGNLIPWLTYNYLQDPFCHECVLLPKCCGGCPHQRLFPASSTDLHHFCSPHMATLDERIKAFALHRNKKKTEKQ